MIYKLKKKNYGQSQTKFLDNKHFTTMLIFSVLSFVRENAMIVFTFTYLQK